MNAMKRHSLTTAPHPWGWTVWNDVAATGFNNRPTPVGMDRIGG